MTTKSNCLLLLLPYCNQFKGAAQGQNCPDFQLQSCVFCLYCLVISRFFILFYIFIPASAFSSNFFIWKKLGPPRGRSEPVRLDIRLKALASSLITGVADSTSHKGRKHPVPHFSSVFSRSSLLKAPLSPTSTTLGCSWSTEAGT